MKAGYVYMLSNRCRGTLYIGVTSDLIRRIWQHREKMMEDFSKRYNLTRLVWYEMHDTIESAIITEKKLKNRERHMKIKLIEGINPKWQDLYPELCSQGSCAAASQPAG